MSHKIKKLKVGNGCSFLFFEIQGVAYYIRLGL